MTIFFQRGINTLCKSFKYQVVSDTWSQWLHYPRKRNMASYSQFLSKCLLFFCIKLWDELSSHTKNQIYECVQIKFRAKVMFCNMCVLWNKMLSSWWENNICCWQNVTLLSPTIPHNFPQNSTFIHVSRLALVDSVLLLLMPGSHPHWW